MGTTVGIRGGYRVTSKHYKLETLTDHKEAESCYKRHRTADAVTVILFDMTESRLLSALKMVTCTHNKKVWVCVFFGVSLAINLQMYKSLATEVDIKIKEKTSPSNGTFQSRGPSYPSNRKFQILWYNPPPFLRTYRNDTVYNTGFDKCKYSNCKMTFNKSKGSNSQAVIFDGRFMPRNLSYIRPNGQIWIFAAHESPCVYGKGHNWLYRNINYLFNWTMTYNKANTDIFLPYGEILRHKHKVVRDFKATAQNKNRTLLLITPDCHTYSKRLQYVKLLQKYVDVEILGKCGKTWNFGEKLRHNDCFQLLNTTFRFYLAFENALCHQYFTEKFYENFNYDLIMLTRGGGPGETRKLLPKGSYVVTEDFKSIKHLANVLKHLSVDDYARMLQQNSQYYSHGYSKVYQIALCNICERMNFMNKQIFKNYKEYS